MPIRRSILEYDDFDLVRNFLEIGVAVSDSEPIENVPPAMNDDVLPILGLSAGIAIASKCFATSDAGLGGILRDEVRATPSADEGCEVVPQGS